MSRLLLGKDDLYSGDITILSSMHIVCNLLVLNFCLQLEDGDIICYQRTITREEEESYRYPDVPSFLEYVRNRQVIMW